MFNRPEQYFLDELTPADVYALDIRLARFWLRVNGCSNIKIYGKKDQKGSFDSQQHVRIEFECESPGELDPFLNQMEITVSGFYIYEIQKDNYALFCWPLSLSKFMWPEKRPDDLLPVSVNASSFSYTPLSKIIAAEKTQEPALRQLIQTAKLPAHRLEKSFLEAIIARMALNPGAGFDAILDVCHSHWPTAYSQGVVNKEFREETRALLKKLAPRLDNRLKEALLLDHRSAQRRAAQETLAALGVHPEKSKYAAGAPTTFAPLLTAPTGDSEAPFTLLSDEAPSVCGGCSII